MPEGKPPVIPPLQSQRLYKQIAGLLESWIRQGVYQPWTHLPPERELAQMLKVSRTSVREALIALEVNDLVSIRVGSGVEVRPLAADAAAAPAIGASVEERSPLEQLKARRLVEGEIAALAAKNATDQHLRDLVDAIAALGKPLDDWETFLSADYAFHQTLALAANNLVLADMMGYLWSLRRQAAFKKFEELYTSNVAEQNAVIEEHERIFEAVRSHDAREARRRMHDHLDRVIQRFVR